MQAVSNIIIMHLHNIILICVSDCLTAVAWYKRVLYIYIYSVAIIYISNLLKEYY